MTAKKTLLLQTCKKVIFPNDKENHNNNPNLDLCKRLGIALNNWETYRNKILVQYRQGNPGKRKYCDKIKIVVEVINTLETLLEEK